MAQYDAADLLARVRTDLQRPEVSEDNPDALFYQYLEEAQVYWAGQFAVHAPEVLYSPPEPMTTADGGLTYTTANYPIGHMEIRHGRGGALLTPGPDWDDRADYTPEGQTIRMPGGRARTFPQGLYARYVAVPGLLNEDNEPTLRPPHMRLLLVPRACYYYATRGGYRDPAPYLLKEQKLWGGDPNLAGDTGFLGQLKTQVFGSGVAAVRGGSDQPWWRSSADFGVGG